MASTDSRTFTKKVGDQTLTRTVVTAADEVAATYDGFTESKSAAKKATGTAGS